MNRKNYLMLLRVEDNANDVIMRLKLEFCKESLGDRRSFSSVVCIHIFYRFCFSIAILEDNPTSRITATSQTFRKHCSHPLTCLSAHPNQLPYFLCRSTFVLFKLVLFNLLIPNLSSW